MSDATSTTPACPPVTSPDLTTFARVDTLGLRVDAQQIWPDKAILFCSLVTVDDRCPRCGAGGRVHDQVLRRFTHLPVGRRPTWLSVRVPRFRCDGCGRVWRHSLKTVARPRSKLTRAADWWALCQVVLDHTPISGVAAVLGISWDTAHMAVTDVGTQLLIDHPGRLDGVEVVGVDEHAWRHTRKGDKYVTVIIDLTPIRDDTGPARLLDLVEGRSKKAFKTWLEAQTDQFRARVAIVAMDGFTGFKTAAAEAVPDATAVMDPFHVVALAGDKLNATRQRVQRELTGGRGRADDPLYKARRTLRTGRALLTDKQKARLSALWAIDEAVPLEVTWLTYQDIMGRGIVKTCGWACQAACSSVADSAGRSTSLPFLKRAPARTRATRWGAFTARQRAWADSSSLNAIAIPAARDPGPLVTRCRSRRVANVDSIGLVVRRWTQCSAGNSKNASSTSRSSVIFAAALGHLTPYSAANALAAARAWSTSSAA